jgi:hypothetical protein
MPEPLTPDDLAIMEQAARRFQGAFTGTSGSLAGYVILLLRERERLVTELAVERARRQDA